MKTIASFNLTTEVHLEVFKSRFMNFMTIVRRLANENDGRLVINNREFLLSEAKDEVIDFEKKILEIGSGSGEDGQFPQVVFPSDSPYIIKTSEQNDIELNQLDVEKSLALLSPYSGTVDTVNVQIIFYDMSATDLKNEVEKMGKLTDFSLSIADNHNYFELGH